MQGCLEGGLHQFPDMLASLRGVACPEDEKRTISDSGPCGPVQDSRFACGVAIPFDTSHAFPIQAQVVSIHTLNPLLDDRWDDLVARHPKASVFHQRGWLEALARTYGYEPIVFTTSSPTAELRNGLVFCRVSSWLTGTRLVSLPFSDHCEPICDSAEELNSLINYSQAVMERQGWQYLELRPVDENFGRPGAGFSCRPAGTYFLHLIDLRPGLDEVFQSLNKDSVRRRIQRGDQAGLVERCGTSPDLLRDFYKMLVTTRSRHQLPPPPFAWFQNIVQCMGSGLEIRAAYKDENPIAAILTLRFRNIGYFKYGCSDFRFNRFGATPWLLWRAIAAAKSSGAVEFDLGRTQEDNAGLLNFKNHWVASHKRLVYRRFPGTPAAEMVGGWKLKTAKRVFSYMPDRLLAATGKLLYRHIG
jgi:hypothetical protein